MSFLIFLLHILKSQHIIYSRKEDAMENDMKNIVKRIKADRPGDIQCYGVS